MISYFNNLPKVKPSPRTESVIRQNKVKYLRFCCKNFKPRTVFPGVERTHVDRILSVLCSLFAGVYLPSHWMCRVAKEYRFLVSATGGHFITADLNRRHFSYSGNLNPGKALNEMSSDVCNLVFPCTPSVKYLLSSKITTF